MRIATLQLFHQGVNSILDQQTRLFKTQNQLATGKRINNPGDDPTGATRLISLSQTTETTSQYQKNILAARTRLEQEDTALGSVDNAIQRVRELMVQGLNDTNSAAERKAIATEIRQLADEVRGLANRKDANGQFLFAGLQVLTQPFTKSGSNTVYNGDQGQRQIQIAAAHQIADGDSGQAVFMDIPDGSGGTSSIFKTLENIAGDLDANAPVSTRLDQIDRAINQFVTFRSSAGARLNALDNQENINKEMLFQLEKTRSVIEDVNYTEAATRLSQQSVALQAAQQAFVKIQNLSLFNFL